MKMKETINKIQLLKSKSINGLDEVKSDLIIKKVQCASLEDLQASQKLFNQICKFIRELDNTMLQVKLIYNTLIKVISSEDNVEIIEDRNSSPKVGKYIKSKLLDFFNANSLSVEQINEMCSRNWSRSTLKLDFSLLKEINSNKSIQEQIKVNGNNRYWKETVNILGRKYVICSQWYENQRVYFDKWIKSMDLTFHNAAENINENNLDILNLFNTFTGRKPVKFVFLSKEVYVASWKELYLEISKQLWDIDREKFKAMAYDPSMQGRNMELISFNTNKMRSPVEVYRTGLFLETNISANSIKKRIELMLKKYNIELIEIEIYCR